MSKLLTSIVLGLSSLAGCILEKDLRVEYLNSENVSGNIVRVDEDSFFDYWKEYTRFFEVLDVKTAQGIKKVLIPHATSYADGEIFSGSCRKIESGIVRFYDLVGYETITGADQTYLIQKGSIKTDYLFLDDMYYEPKK